MNKINGKKKNDLSLIPINEIKKINGGGWLSYWLGAIVAIGENMHGAYAYTPEGKAVQQALRDFQ